MEASQAGSEWGGLCVGSTSPVRTLLLSQFLLWTVGKPLTFQFIIA
jgi:hypothetical protein